jgi:hypothetical protein
MENQPNQPGEYDAVLGDQKRSPRDGDMVLGDTEKFIQQGRAYYSLKDYQGAIYKLVPTEAMYTTSGALPVLK